MTALAAKNSSARDERDVAVPVGAVGPGTQLLEVADRRGRRVTVGIAGAGRRDRRAGADRVKELRCLLGAAVVGRLQDIGCQRDAERQQSSLRLVLDVTGEQDGCAAGRGESDHQRGVVGIAVGAAVGSLRGEDPPTGLPGRPLLPHLRLDDRDVGAGRPLLDALTLDSRLIERADLDLADAAPAQDPRQPLDVVGVQVSQHDQRDPAHPQPVQAGVDGPRIRPGVDDDRAAGPRGKHDGVALADVAHHQEPPRRRPPGAEQVQAHRGEQDAGAARGGDPPEQRRASHPPAQDSEQHQQGRSGAAALPRDGCAGQCRAGARHADQPRGRQVGQPGGELGERQAERRNQGGHDAEHSRGGDDRDGEQVGRYGQQAELRRQRHDDRAANHLRRGGNRQGLGRPSRQVTGERRAPVRGEDHQAGGRQHRQGETG